MTLVAGQQVALAFPLVVTEGFKGFAERQEVNWKWVGAGLLGKMGWAARIGKRIRVSRKGIGRVW